MRATQDLSRFDLDFLLQVLLVAIREPSSHRLDRLASHIQHQPAQIAVALLRLADWSFFSGMTALMRRLRRWALLAWEE
ncbi:hypothetical protein AB5J55_12145 [Streptomyces sp. R11]|uniref:Uncharacterized protein n=1 Tax=Streptomyces sp. R11 TaxID=3238625 RepID=A0AB39NHJ8_9ACTN